MPGKHHQYSSEGIIRTIGTHIIGRGGKVCSVHCPLPLMHWISSSSRSSLERSHTRWALPFVTLLIEFVGACVHGPKKQATSHLKIQSKKKQNHFKENYTIKA